MAEFEPVRLLVWRTADGEPLEGLLRFLEATGRFRVEVGGRLRRGAHQVVLGVGRRAPEDAETAALEDHLQAGGGLLLAGSAVAGWLESRRLNALLGWAPSEAAPASELRLQPTPGGPISERLGEEIRLHDRIFLGDLCKHQLCSFAAVARSQHQVPGQLPWPENDDSFPARRYE